MHDPRPDQPVHRRAVTCNTGENTTLTTALLLATLAEQLASGGDPFFARPELREISARLEGLPDERRVAAEAVSGWQRAALTALTDRLAQQGADLRWKREMRVIQRSLERLVEVLAMWPRAAPLELDELTLHLARHDLAALAREVCSTFSPLADERDLTFRVDLPASLPAEIDGEKIQLAIVNLVFNAFKMTPTHGSVRVDIEVNDLTSEALLSVSDSGPGLPPTHVHALFNRHRTWERSGDSGRRLGFSLGQSRDYLELHGGELRAAHRSARPGAEFLVRIPLLAPIGVPVADDPPPLSDLPRRAARAAAAELEVEASLGEDAPPRDDRPLVLIVDDSRAIHRMLVDDLGATCRTVSAFDGVSGLQKACELEPDIIIADLQLPGMGGQAMVRALRARPGLAEVPILVITAGRDPNEIVQLLEDGVQDVLHKPFVLPEVRVRIRNLLASKQTRDVLRALVGERETDLVRLADEVYRQQRRLEAALDEVRVARELVETAGRVKTNFLRMVSHELKTPVTALSLQLQLLSRDPEMSAASPRAEGLARMSRSISRLLHLVDTVIEWARVESGRCHVSVKKVDLLQVAREAVREIEPQTSAKGIELVLEGPDSEAPSFNSDPRLVRLVVINLLERAVRVTERGTVRVQVRSDDGAHALRVIDGAPTITGAERFDLFEPMRSTEDLALMKGAGSGLGLYVVRDIARAAGGDVVLCELGSPGNTFELTLTDLSHDDQQRTKENADVMGNLAR